MDEKLAESSKNTQKRGLISVAELSEFTGVSTHTLYSWVLQRSIPFYKIGKLVRFNISEIEKWLETKKVKVGDFSRERT